MEMNKSYSLSTKGGHVVALAESNNPDTVILSISDGGKAVSVQLTREEFKAIMDLDYTIKFASAEVSV